MVLDFNLFVQTTLWYILCIIIYLVSLRCPIIMILHIFLLFTFRAPGGVGSNIFACMSDGRLA